MEIVLSKDAELLSRSSGSAPAGQEGEFAIWR